MTRAKKQQRGVELINITQAAALVNLHRWQVRYVCQKYHLKAIAPPSSTDRRCKLFPKDRLLTLIQMEHTLPLAS